MKRARTKAPIGGGGSDSPREPPMPAGRTLLDVVASQDRNERLPSVKRRFPFRLGTTSYILHDEILPNVRYLKDKVDFIELLVFESDESSSYLSEDEVTELSAISAEHDLAYTVHLPIGVHLGARDESARRENVDTVLRAIDATRALRPHASDLHLEPDEGSPIRPIHDLPEWQDACLRSLEDLKAGGANPFKTGVETLEYPFEYAEPLVAASGFGICLDIGHLWRRCYDEDWLVEALLPRARSIHLHGWDEVRDHRGLHHLPVGKSKRFIDAIAAQPDAADRTLSIEVFAEGQLIPSLEVLDAIA